MDETRIIERAGRRWLVRPAAAEPLLADGWPMDDPGRLTPVKRGRRRTVCRLQTAGRGYYVKAFEPVGPLRRLRARLGMGPGRREWDALLMARAAGLDVPEPVALALGAAEALVTREIAGGQRLDAYLFERYFEATPADPPNPRAPPPELVAAVSPPRPPPARPLDPPPPGENQGPHRAPRAEADLYLPDLHPGNLLISGPPRQWHLSLVDLAEAVRPAPPEALLQHLMQLEHFFEPIAGASERLRCLVRLRELTPEAPSARDVARATAVYRQRFYLRRDRRTRRRSKYFRRIAAGAWRGWATADWAEAVTAFLGAGGGDDPLAGAQATVLKDGRTSSVWRVQLDDGRSLIVKRHNRAAERNAAHSLARPSRSMRALRRGHALLVRGIATARPAAAVDLRRHGTPADTLLLTEPVAGAQPLSDWLRAAPPAADRRHVVWELARMIRRMHEAGLTHRDLKAPNILIARAPASAPRPVLVDLDGLRLVRRVSARRRARDLMRLSVSLQEWGVARRTDRLRFLRTYLQRPGCPAPITVLSRRRGGSGAARRLRRWWRHIARASRRKRDTLRRKYGHLETA